MFHERRVVRAMRQETLGRRSHCGLIRVCARRGGACRQPCFLIKPEWGTDLTIAKPAKSGGPRMPGNTKREQ